MLAKGLDKEYLPIEGLAAFRKATIDLLLGADSAAVKEGRVACLQVRRKQDGCACSGGSGVLWERKTAGSSGAGLRLLCCRG